MNLFINAVSEKGYLALFNSQREIIDSQVLDIKGNESSQFIEILDNFLHKNSCEYNQIDNIVCVN
jgi:tRNA A37 threonylcarbamoyladenosine modification protein TsaB